MSQNEAEEKLFMLMAHAEELQSIADKSAQAVNGAVKRIENDSANAIINSIRAGIDKTLADTKKELQEATTGLVGASFEAKTTCALLKSTGLFQGFFLVAVGIIICGVTFGIISFIAKSKLAELDELKATIRAEQSTLAELEGKTWGLELITSDGKRWIRFKKGDTVGEKVFWKNGREGIEVKP